MNTLSIQRPRPSIETRTPALISTPVKASLVNWLPWSVLKISGRACRSLAVSGQRVLERRHAERRVDRVRQPPGKNRPARPVDDGDQIEKSAADRDVGVSGPPRPGSAG